MSAAHINSANTFPNSIADGIPPSPTLENPGQVFPQTDPSKGNSPNLSSTTAERYVGNPYLVREALKKLDRTLGEIIGILVDEENAHSASEEESPLLQKFRDWRDELDDLRAGRRTPWMSPTTRSPLPRTPIRTKSSDQNGIFLD